MAAPLNRCLPVPPGVRRRHPQVMHASQRPRSLREPVILLQRSCHGTVNVFDRVVFGSASFRLVGSIDVDGC